MNFKEIKSLARETFKEWSEDKAGRLAAALSYYTIFSLPPLLIIILVIAGRFFDDAEARFTAQINSLIGPTGGEAITAILENASRPSDSIIAAIIGVVTLLLGASGVFGQLQEAMNTIWDVPPQPKGGILEIIKDRFFSFTMVIGVGFLLLVSLIVSAALTSLNDIVTNVLPGLLFLAQLINILVSLAVVTLLFALLFKVVPDVDIAWRDVWVGALVTAVLFTAGKWAISLYLAKSAPASAYGAAGSLIIILLWIYYSAQILFLGAEFTQVYASRYGTQIVADWLTPEQEGGSVTVSNTMPGQRTAVQGGHSISNRSLPAADTRITSNAPYNDQPGQAAELPDKAKPLARLIKNYHRYLVSILAIPAALVQFGRNALRMQ
jgi:membrane protein